jgi:ABC-2 type transport system permease protein
VALGIAAFNSSPPTQAQSDLAQTQYDQNFERCMTGGKQASTEVPPGYDSMEDYCSKNSTPFVEGAGMTLRDLDQILQGIATFVILLGAVLGASLGGADWTNNTMTTLLTWEPRRNRVLLTRALVAVVVAFAITLFLQGVFAGLFALGASTRGSTAFTPPSLGSDVLQTVLRTSGVAAAFALIAYAVAMLGRSTVASVGVLFGYLILVEMVIAGFRQSIQGWLVVRAGIVVVTQSPILDVSSVESGGGLGQPDVLMSVARANAVLGVYALVLLAVALIVFRRRDVT